MKRSLTFALLVLVATAFSQDAILMRRTFTNDLVEKFKVKGEHTITVNSDGEEFESSMSLLNNRTFTFSKVEPEGKAMFKYEDTNYTGTETAEGETTKIENPEFYDEIFTAKINPFMECAEIKVQTTEAGGADEDEEVDPIGDALGASDLSQYYFQLPTKAVKPGDEWSIPIKQEKLFKPNQVVKGKFRGAEKWEEQDVLVIEYTTTADLDVNLDEYDNGKPAFPDITGAKLTAQVNDSAIVYLDPKDFSILYCLDKVTMTLEFKSSEANMTMKNKGEEEMRRSK